MRASNPFNLTPLNIRLHQPVGNLPAGPVIEVPEFMALALIRRRLAVPVGDASIMPDVVVADEDVRFLEIECDPLWIAAGMETVDAAPAMESR